MKNIIILIILLAIKVSCYGQKPPLTLDSYKTWPEVTGGGISENNSYAFYNILNYPVGRNTFILSTVDGKEIMKQIGLRNANFSRNSEYLFGMLPEDTLIVYNLQKKLIFKLPEIKGYELKNISKHERLILKRDSGLLICNYGGKSIKSFNQVQEYKFSLSGGNLMLLQRKDQAKDSTFCKWIDLITGKEKEIYSGKNIENITFDDEGKQVAFTVNEDGNNSIYYFNEKLDKAALLVGRKAKGFDTTMAISATQHWGFSKDGKRIFFSLKINGIERELNRENPEIWSYWDSYIRTNIDLNKRQTELFGVEYLSMVNISDKKVTQLLKGKQKIVLNTFNHDSDTVLVVKSSAGGVTEEWNSKASASYYLCYTKTGELVPIETNKNKHLERWYVSPTGKFVLYFDIDKKIYICYNTQLKNKVKIGEGIEPIVWFSKLHYPNPERFTVGITGWLNNDEAVLINGSYDIWKVDPMGKNLPVNLTSNVSRQNSKVFYLLGEQIGGTVARDGYLLLGAFDTKSKTYGFYRKEIYQSGTLEKLSEHTRFWSHLDDVYLQMKDDDFMSNSKKTGYLLRWETPDEAPNYYFSKDLKKINQISNVQPQRGYNWMTAELHNYTDSIGNEYQGVLYKPENFNPSHQYPLIMNIYERRSDELNEFRRPESVGANFNIPIMVSNGYLVFLPDIKGIVRDPGKGALRSVEAAAEHLAKLRWVNTKKMALVGHSFGGFETNYIITHSDRFAAAISAAGIRNMVNATTDLWGSTAEPKQSFEQYGPTIMEVPLSEDPDAYIRNSPILDSKNLNTPVLFMHNDADGNVDVKHTQSFFIVLRSLNKPCWWLNYKGQKHGVTGKENQLNFNTKTWQFLDHYLKNKPMPDWMKEHI